MQDLKRRSASPFFARAGFGVMNEIASHGIHSLTRRAACDFRFVSHNEVTDRISSNRPREPLTVAIPVQLCSTVATDRVSYHQGAFNVANHVTCRVTWGSHLAFMVGDMCPQLQLTLTHMHVEQGT